MNRDRRNRIDKVLGQLEELKQEVYDILDEEQEAYDNLPESFQNGERGDSMQEAIDALENAGNSFDDVIEYLEEANDH